MRNAKRNQIVLLLIALHVLVVVAVYWILKRCLHQFGFDINVMQFIALLVLVAIIKRAFGVATK
jgi:uncharacterized membrane protein YwzB